MKVKKDGTVKLERDEIRVGNFFVKRESEHMKIEDLNGVFSFRAYNRIPIGIWLENIWERAKKGETVSENTLKTYIATMWSVFSVAPDDDYIKDAIQMADAAFHRHPDWYGIDADATDEEHEEALREVKEMKQFEEEVKDMAEKADGGED